MLFYIDDILVLYDKKDEKRVREVIDRMLEVYKIRDEGDVEWFLGIKVIRDREARKISLVYNAYIEKIAKRYNLVYLYTRFPSTLLLGIKIGKFKGTTIKVGIKAF